MHRFNSCLIAQERVNVPSRSEAFGDTFATADIFMYNGEFLIKVGREKLFHVLRVDRIYARGLSVVRVEVHHGLPWSRISDHAALSEKLELS